MNHPEAIESPRDRYRGVVIILLAAAALGAAIAIVGALKLENPVLFATAVTLGIAAGVLAGVAYAQAVRSGPPGPPETAPLQPADTDVSEAQSSVPESLTARRAALAARAALLRSRLLANSRKMLQWIGGTGWMNAIRFTVALSGALAICFLVLRDFTFIPPGPLVAAIAAGVCLVAAGLAATASHYLASQDPALFPESPALRRGARAVAWLLILTAISMAPAWAGQQTTLHVLFLVILTVNAVFCYGLFQIRDAGATEVGVRQAIFPLDVGILAVLGGRTNILASILDSAERQLGIDLRSTWALTVVRRSIEPLILGLCVLGWLSTSFTVVGLQEQGLVERFGVAVKGQPLSPGLHLHFPWPVDQVLRIPVRRVQKLVVGHEGKEEAGPEDVLWAVQHTASEFTLLLGDGRDLITIDAGVQFRIKDARAWRYNSQNPETALSAIAYRAVMRNTVNLTLSDALSQNLAALTARMRGMIQQDADALGLGVEILGFTVGGMHPPVAVAKDYQAVVSAELRKVTAVARAQVYRAELLPQATAWAVAGANTALAEGAEALGKAAGEAWSFRTLQSQYRADPGQYFFRRRLETLEKGLVNRNFTVVDSRFERDGGELWLVP
jgi:regulator of protease activity HflC (stomatin/prohibitin superfamily)